MIYPTGIAISGFFIFKNFLKKDFLKYVFIFSFFPALAIIDLAGTTINISQLFALVYVVKIFSELFFKKKKIRIGNKYLLIFMIYLPISWLINIIKVNPDIIFISQKGVLKTFLEKQNLDFIKHYLLILICYMTYVSAYNDILYLRKLRKINLNKIYEPIFKILIILTIVQIIFWYFKIPYDEIFRPHPNTFPQSVVFLGQKIVRVAPTFLEPSMQSVAFSTLGSYFLLKKGYIKNKILFFIFGILSLSTTYVIGVLIIICLKILRFNRKKIIFIIVITIIINIIFYFLIPQYADVINETIDKIQGKGVSGKSRLRQMLVNYNIFKNNVLLGIGFGMTRSADLISTWFANIGVLGVIVFIVAIFKSYNKRAKTIFQQTIIFFLISAISVPEPYYIFIWIIWAINDSIIKNFRRKSGKKNFNSIRSSLLEDQ